MLKNIRDKTPLCENITNYVVTNNTANALLAIGASPCMTHELGELEDIINISSSVTINMGTLYVDSFIKAVTYAKATNKPIAFDPVAMGASKLRNETAKKIMNAGPPNVIRGNASEIIALASEMGVKLPEDYLFQESKGVDSTASSDSAVEIAKLLSTAQNCTIIVSGATD